LWSGSSDSLAVTWLDPAFTPPARLDLTTGHHLRPIREADLEIDYPAVMGSWRRLWEKYGEAWGWPSATMSREDDREDLARHDAEALAREAFNYAILDQDEIRLLGCVYIDPPEAGAPPGSDAMVSWWVIDDAVGTALEQALDDVLPRWLSQAWGFEAVHLHP
jgi:hypothetical protein